MRVGSTAKKMTRDGNTPITHKQKQFDTLSLEMDECLRSAKDCAIFSCVLGKKKPTSFSDFSPDAIEVTIGKVLPNIFVQV